MGLYNFQPRFLPAINAGTKRHTIRAVRAHPDRPGSTLHLYTGLRTKGAKLIMRVPCTQVCEITIGVKGLIHVDGRRLSELEAETLATHDGFGCLDEMIGFWRDSGRLPFRGHLILWC